MTRGRVAVIGVVVGAFLFGAFLFYEGTQTEIDLRTVVEDVAEVREALASNDLAAAGESLGRARATTDRAAVRVGRAHWRVLERFPAIGRSAAIIRGAVDVAGAALAIAEEAIASGEALLTGDATVTVVDDGRLDLASLDHARSVLDALPVAELEQARDRLAATPESLVPRRIHDGRRRALDNADEALSLVARAREGLHVLPAFLGAEGTRRYLLAMQNPAELRGTGGLVGFIAVLTVDDGRFELSEPQAYGIIHEDLESALALAEQGEIQPEDIESFLDPVPTTNEFAVRYGHTGAARFFGNANLDPDLPTSAPVMLDIYEDRTGLALDGLIVVDPIGIAILLEGAGSLRIPDEVRDADGQIPAQLAPADVPRATMIDAYDAFGGPSPARRNFLRTVAEEAFRQIFSGGMVAGGLGRQAIASAVPRHLQLYSRNPGEQQTFESLGVAGVMRPRHARDDLLAVTANNAGGNKMDVHVAHRISGSIALGDAGASRSARLRVELTNPLPTSGRDIHIIGNCLPSTTVLRCFDGPRGLNRTWFTVWAPAGTELLAARDDSGRPIALAGGHIHGHRAFDHYLEVPALSTGGFEVDLVGPSSVEQDGSRLRYRLTLWRQAKAIPDHLDLTLTAPEGWKVADVMLTGGGNGRGMGVAGDGEPVAVTVDGVRVELVGAMTTDLHVEVSFSRSRLSRLWQR